MVLKEVPPLLVLLELLLARTFLYCRKSKNVRKVMDSVYTTLYGRTTMYGRTRNSRRRGVMATYCLHQSVEPLGPKHHLVNHQGVGCL